jgi:hypothetical protein
MAKSDQAIAIIVLAVDVDALLLNLDNSGNRNDLTCRICHAHAQ